MRSRSLVLALSLPLLLGNRPAERTGAELCDDTHEHAMVRELIAHDYGVREGDLSRLCKGRVISGTLPVDNSYEMTVIGMTRLRATAEQFASSAA